MSRIAAHELPDRFQAQVAAQISRPIQPPTRPEQESGDDWVIVFPGLPLARKEYRFHPERKFRADFCWPHKKLLLEIDGGLYVNGGHSRGAAREKDYERDALAMMLGWRVLRVSPRQFKDGSALEWLKALLT